MSAITEDTNNAVDPEAEVKKLQDLVKKLEQQNQILRNKNQVDINKTGSVISTEKNTENGDVRLKTKFKGANDNEKDSSKDYSLEEVALVDVDHGMFEDEDDNWLFKSPKKLSLAQKNKSPYKWLREEFEHPSPEVEVSRRSLSYRLDEMARVSRSSSCGTLGSLGSPINALHVASALSRSQTSPGPASAVSAASPIVDDNHPEPEGVKVPAPSESESDAAESETISFRCSSPAATHHGGSLPHPASMPSIRQPLVSSLDRLGNTGTRVDTGTFTRPKKGSKEPRRRLEYVNDVDPDEPAMPKPISRDELMNDTGSVGSFGSQEDLLDSDGTPLHKLSDVNDVQVLARMQEESLRQSIPSPHMSPRKSSFSNTYSKSGMSRMKKAWAEESENISPNESTRSSPGRFESERLRQEIAHKSNNSLASGSSQSNSPPDSPYGSQYLEQEKHRRSLPNLTKSFGSSGLSVFQGGSKESPPRMMTRPAQRARSPGSGARQASPGRTLSPAERTLSPGRTLSPHRSGIPAPRSSGLPRPGSTSRLPTPRRSGIPSPRKPAAASRGIDDSWKDGCF